MNLQSPKEIVQKSAQEMFDKLCDVNNYKTLMPENIEKFEVTAPDSFIFGLKGMPEIKLVIKEKIASSKVVLGAASDKLPFKLIANIESIDDSSSQIHLDFEGEFNAMMAMMIKGPIGKFLESLVGNMGRL